MSKLRPLTDHIIVKRQAVKTTTSGGIIIPESAKEKPLEGEVLAVGSGRVLDNGEVRPLGVSVGEAILFTKYAGTEVQYDGEDYLLMREEDVLAVLSR